MHYALFHNKKPQPAQPYWAIKKVTFITEELIAKKVLGKDKRLLQSSFKYKTSPY